MGASSRDMVSVGIRREAGTAISSSLCLPAAHPQSGKSRKQYICPCSRFPVETGPHPPHRISITLKSFTISSVIRKSCLSPMLPRIHPGPSQTLPLGPSHSLYPAPVGLKSSLAPGPGLCLPRSRAMSYLLFPIVSSFHNTKPL